MVLFDFLDVIMKTTWWQYVVFNNAVGEYVLSIGVFFVFLGVFKVFQLIILKKLNSLAKKTQTDIDDTLIKIVRSLRPPFYSFIAFYVAIQFLSFGNSFQKILNILLLAWVVYQIIIATQILIEYIFQKLLQKNNDPGSSGAFNMAKNVLKISLWVVGSLMVLSNLGIDVTALVAGLGIGGIAIAFAFQNILEDLFSSFAILFDKPFQIGDYIVVGDKKGTVRKIGIKTTRITSSQGEEIVISNKELTSAQVLNFKKMEERRISFSIGITYETETDKLKQIPTMIKNIIENIKGARFDRSHFKSFADSSLIFETVFYVESPEYLKFMDIQQDINFKIREKFETEGIDMAYPTQTLYIQK